MDPYCLVMGFQRYPVLIKNLNTKLELIKILKINEKSESRLLRLSLKKFVKSYMSLEARKLPPGGQIFIINLTSLAIYYLSLPLL